MSSKFCYVRRNFFNNLVILLFYFLILCPYFLLFIFRHTLWNTFDFIFIYFKEVLAYREEFLLLIRNLEAFEVLPSHNLLNASLKNNHYRQLNKSLKN